MASNYNSQDLIKTALQFAGEESNGRSKYHTLAIKYLNDVYLGLLSGSSEYGFDIGQPWVWARAQNPIHVTLQVYVQGTVSLTTYSSSGTLASAPKDIYGNNLSVQNWYLFVPGLPSYYLVTSHTSGSTQITLDTGYLEPTGSALECWLLPLIYEIGATLPSPILRLAEAFRVYGNLCATPWGNKQEDGKIYGVDLNRFQKDHPLREVQTGCPDRFATWRRTESSWQVIFNRYSGVAPIKADIDYIPYPEELTDSSASIPILPREFRKILAYGAAFHLLSDKLDKRAEEYMKLTQAKFKSLMQAENRMIQSTSENRGRLVARQDLNNRRLYYY